MSRRRYKAELAELRQRVNRSNQAFAAHGFQTAEAAAQYHREREAVHADTKDKLTAKTAEVAALNERLAALAHEKEIAVLELEQQVCLCCVRVRIGRLCVCV